jgi:hypothetical protein
MSPQIPGTGVFSLESTLGLSFPRHSGLEPLELGGIQSCFAVSGSQAEAWNLHQHRKAAARSAYGNKGPIFVHSGLGDSIHNTSTTGVYAASGSSGHDTMDASGRTVLDHGWGALDIYPSGFPDTIEDR